jgi:hypothetical protein
MVTTSRRRARRLVPSFGFHQAVDEALEARTSDAAARRAAPHSLAIARSTSSGRPPGGENRATIGQGASRTTTTRLVTGTAVFSPRSPTVTSTERRHADDQPGSSAWTAMMIDSQRTVERTCDRHPDRPEQPELAGPLEDRQRQGVGDAEQGDDDGEHQQRVEHPEHRVDLAVDDIEEGVLVSTSADAWAAAAW